MGVAKVKRLKILEEENRKLKQLVADLSLDKQMLQDVIRKKVKACLVPGIWSIVAGMLRGKWKGGVPGAPESPTGLRL